MIIFFSADEMGGSCNRTSYMEAIKKFYKLTGREAKIAWMSTKCVFDMEKWARDSDEDKISEEELFDRVRSSTGTDDKFKVMVSIHLTDPSMYFGVGD